METTFIDGAAPNKFHADLYAIARFILQSLELKSFRGDQCSYQQQDEYFSYRRDAKLAVWQLLFLCSFENHIFLKDMIVLIILSYVV